MRVRFAIFTSLFLSILTMGICTADVPYVVFGEKFEEKFSCRGMSFDAAVENLIKTFAKQNGFGMGLNSSFMVVPEELKKRERAKDFKASSLEFGVALTELCDAYGVAFRLAGDALVVFDPVSDPVSHRYSGFVAVPDAILSKMIGPNGEDNSLNWLTEKGLNLWDGEKVSILKNYDVLVCESRPEIRAHLRLLLQLIESGIVK